MISFVTLDDVDVAAKRVLVRLDLNVPMKNGEVTDTTRIDRQAPTVRELAEKGARVILLSHFERPGGKVVPEMSLKPVAPALARALASLGDLYVNDAFSAAHRAHASTEGVAHLLSSVAGRSMEAELSHLERAVEKPERPLMAVVGGAKIFSKITLLENLTSRVDVLVIGGAMANTFLAAQGLRIGRSLSESDQIDVAKRCIAAARSRDVTLLLPTDVVVAHDLKANTRSRIV